MEYQVTLTPQAIQQIQETAFYISRVLRESETVKRWTELLYKEISALNFMPSRYSLTAEEPWRSNGIRKMSVKNFLVYYLVDEENKRVSGTAVIYARRDQLAALTDMPSD